MEFTANKDACRNTRDTLQKNTSELPQRNLALVLDDPWSYHEDIFPDEFWYFVKDKFLCSFWASASRSWIIAIRLT